MHVRVCVCMYRPLFIEQHNERHNNNVNVGQKCPLDRKVVVMFVFYATLPSNRHFMSAFTDLFGFIHMGVQSYLLDTGCTIPQLMSCIMEVPPSLSPPPPLSLSPPPPPPSVSFSPHLQPLRHGLHHPSTDELYHGGPSLPPSLSLSPSLPLSPSPPLPPPLSLSLPISYLLDTGCTIPQLMSCIMEVPIMRVGHLRRMRRSTSISGIFLELIVKNLISFLRHQALAEHALLRGGFPPRQNGRL